MQHQHIADRQARYTSIDLGAYLEKDGWHIEAEVLRKFYAHNAFDNCTALSSMLVYRHEIKKEECFVQAVSALARYDYMQDHSSGKSGMDETTGKLVLTDAERHRMTLGTTISVNNRYFPTDIRLNYEKYWYPHGGAKESEMDKIVCELMIRF